MAKEDAPARAAPHAREKVDYEALADFLSALSYPARLELLDVLRFPHVLGEIQLSPRRGSPGVEPAKQASRPTILGHINKLVEAGLVKAEPVQQEGRSVHRYAVNPAKLYAVIEELRRLSVMYAGRGLPGDATGTLQGAAAPEAVKGPRLVLVHGVYEGKAFALTPASADEPDDAGTARWLVGRRRGVAVCLDYDPFVSLENAAVERSADGTFAVRDLPQSKNGTALNWAPLPRDRPRALHPGDVIGLGRSALVFAAH